MIWIRTCISARLSNPTPKPSWTPSNHCEQRSKSILPQRNDWIRTIGQWIQVTGYTFLAIIDFQKCNKCHFTCKQWFLLHFLMVLTLPVTRKKCSFCGKLYDIWNLVTVLWFQIELVHDLEHDLVYESTIT